MLHFCGALAVVCCVACNPGTPENVYKIVVGAEMVPHAAPVWVAEKRGYFRDEGLRVEIREFDSGRTALRTMLSSEGVDIATAAQTPVVANSFQRNDYAIIGNMVYADNDTKILARRDREIRQPADLKSKTVGITGGSSGHFFLGLFLAHHGLRMADVATVDLEPARLSQALIGGQVDAISTWEPYVYKTKKILGDKALVLPSRDIYREDFYFIARKDFIAQNPEALKRFLRAIEKGEAFIGSNPKAAMDIVGQRLKMEEEILIAIWNDFKFRLSLDQLILTSLDDEAHWAMRNTAISTIKMPNYLDYIHTDTLKAVKPGAVRIAGK